MSPPSTRERESVAAFSQADLSGSGGSPWCGGYGSHVFICINVGLGLFIIALLILPLLDMFYLWGRIELHDGFYNTVGAMGLCGLANVLV